MSMRPLSNESSVTPAQRAARVSWAVVRRLSVVALAALVASLTGYVWAIHWNPPPVAAQSPCAEQLSCLGGDTTVTSSLAVDHRTTSGNTPVEPDNSDCWAITATYRPISGGMQCIQAQVQASVTIKVEWKDEGHWEVTCTGCGGLINSVSVCDGSKCTSGGNTHSWEYVLLVDLDLDDGSLGNVFLYSVSYATGTLDDGDTLNTTSCAEVAAVSPAGGASTTDSGPFECAYSCASASGPATTIGYE